MGVDRKLREINLVAFGLAANKDAKLVVLPVLGVPCYREPEVEAGPEVYL